MKKIDCSQRVLEGVVLTLGLVLLSSCSHQQKQKVDEAALAPQPGCYGQQDQQARPRYGGEQARNQNGVRAALGSEGPLVAQSGRIPVTPVPEGGVSLEDLTYIASHRPLQVQDGMATWYTAPYKGRKAANGQVFDERALTAAHRTLPMGSLVKVTNLRTGQSSAMRITDRGPFIDGRVLDLTPASAKAVGVYRAGLDEVRIEVYQTPKPINVGGRWCVQIGAFHDEGDAMKLKRALIRRYTTASVIEFPGDKAYWVRIRPEGDDRSVAEWIARHLKPAEGSAFLTRLD
jgi:rare lipoprotein A